MELPDDVTQWHSEHAGQRIAVYRLSNQVGAPPVLLMHELPGLSEDTLLLGRRLRDSGFDVHLPLLFGSFGQSSTARGIYQMWCLRREFELLRNNRSSAIAERLRALCTELAGQDDRQIGVVGMCASGGLVMSLMYSPAVGAAVAAQPAMPFRLFYTRKSSENLGATASDVAASADSSTPLMALRFTRDPICPANRIRQMRETFGTDYSEYIAPGNSLRHATLTKHAAEAGDAIENTIAFLQITLGAVPAPPADGTP